MEIKDLMIGDWVLFEPFKNDSTPKRVGGVDGGMVSIDCLWEAFHHIRPIPLTKEILEKNGFYGTEEGHYYNYELLYGKLCNERISIRHQNHLIACSTPENRNEFALFGIIVLTYVHELQHALRLCGIDKEIVL